MTRNPFLRPAVGAIAALLLGSALVLGCGSDDDDGGDSTGANSPTAMAGDDSAEEQAVQDAIRTAIQAYSAGNAEQFLTHWTDDGLMAEFGASPDEVRAAGAEFFGGPPIEVGEFKDVEIDSDSATAEFELLFGSVIEPQRYDLIQEGSAWKINDTESLDAEIPSGATRVSVDMDEFSFEFDSSGVKTNVAFELDNVGEQPHEAVLVQVPAGFTLEQLLQSDPAQLPQGVEIVGFAGPYEAGDNGTMVFSDPVPAGNYMFVCFLPDTEDPEQTPHAAKGMAVNFQVTQ
jgi:hypothetical protein